MCPPKTNLPLRSIVLRQNKGETGEQMTKGERARGERQGEDECVCRDDREKDRYGESVTVPIRGRRQIMKTETGVSDEHNACECKRYHVTKEGMFMRVVRQS